MKIIIKNGRVLDPSLGRDEVADIFIKDGVICDTLPPGEDVQVIDAAGWIVAPGFIDMHVHLREPGFEYKETIATGSQAALKGGFTAVAAMPNTNPVIDNRFLVEFVRSRGREADGARIYPIGAITKASQGKQLADLADMRAAGAVAFSDDGQPVTDANMMRLAMRYSSMLDTVLIAHCEDKDLSADGVMHEGYMSTILGLKGIPSSAEEVMVARDILLARETGCPVHIAHLSTAGSVELVRQAKKRGIKVTAEAAPHHFILTDEAVHKYHTAAKVNPPLRSGADVQALRQGLADDTIDVIATDHAPHSYDEKNVEFDQAPFGIVGLETAVSLVWTELVNTGVLTPLQAVRKLSQRPAAILGVPGGTLVPGAMADITMLDPQRTEIVEPQGFASKGRNTPFAGTVVKGVPVLTMIAGQIKFKYC